jgi:hypothetical protein
VREGYSTEHCSKHDKSVGPGVGAGLVSFRIGKMGTIPDFVSLQRLLEGVESCIPGAASAKTVRAHAIAPSVKLFIPILILSPFERVKTVEFSAPNERVKLE